MNNCLWCNKPILEDKSRDGRKIFCNHSCCVQFSRIKTGYYLQWQKKNPIKYNKMIKNWRNKNKSKFNKYMRKYMRLYRKKNKEVKHE